MTRCVAKPDLSGVNGGWWMVDGLPSPWRRLEEEEKLNTGQEEEG